MKNNSRSSSFSRRWPVLLLAFSVLAVSVVIAVSVVKQSRTDEGPVWVRNLDVAKAQAQAAGKDLIIVFTGHGWCHNCEILDREVFQSSDFVSAAGNDFIFMELDFNFGDSAEEKKREGYHRALQRKYLTPAVPTVVFADAEGVPFAIQTDYVTGTGPKKYLEAIRSALAAKALRDRSFEASKSLSGKARARELDKAISYVAPLLGTLKQRGNDPVLVFYGDKIKEIMSLSAGEDDELAAKYRSRKKALEEWQSREEVFAKLKQFGRDCAGAIEFIDRSLKDIKDEEIRWRLENSRRTYLEWSDRHQEALANCRRLLKQPNLTEKQKDNLLEREGYNLFKLGKIDEGLAHFDKLIAAAEGNPKKQLRILEYKSQMILTHRHHGHLQQSIEVWQTYQQATRKGTDDWLTATVLLSRQLRQAGQHKEALRLINEVLEEERDEWLLLDAAEIHIAMGNDAQAKKLIDEARSMNRKYAESERRSELADFKRTEARITSLLEKLSGK